MNKNRLIPGPIPLLQYFEKTYKQGYFEPFTRDFFTKKAEIKGEIKDFTIAGLWLLMKTDYESNEKYYIYASTQSLSFSKENIFTFDFKETKPNITVSGKLYTLEPNILDEIKSIIANSFVGTFDYHLSIHILDAEKAISL